MWNKRWTCDVSISLRLHRPMRPGRRVIWVAQSVQEAHTKVK